MSTLETEKHKAIVKIVIYYLLACFISWTVEIYQILGYSVITSTTALTIMGKVMGLLAMYGPFFSALITQKVIYKKPLKEIGIHFHFKNWPFWVYALLIVVVFTFACIPVEVLQPGIQYDPSYWGFVNREYSSYSEADKQTIVDQLQSQSIFSLVILSLIIGPTYNAFYAFGEEAGWRGMMHHTLKPVFGFKKTSIITGIMWGFWHCPYIVLLGLNYPQHPGIGPLWFAIDLGCQAAMFHLAADRTGTAVASAITHGVYNALAPLAAQFAAGGSDLTCGVTGTAGMITGVIFTAVIFVWYDRYVSEDEELQEVKEKLLDGDADVNNAC
eukprot:gnl/Dysnectes_brevis/3927_a5112_884.p1 GENE.gnl/Dysnectes_brevis/3927_a5112_884~~gnl/Dysnectes_brevis/3927_a5112_884.p1  ORF type:complete len:345 (-),score=22.22 gnl/Dysnectes_brevis/3927_a5112_884:52-1035(-)